MKTEPKLLHCSRCGDEILPSEQSSPNDTICALCEHIQLEAKQIYNDKKNNLPTLPVNNLYKLNR